ncbi:hypothetical protein [Streptomyces sp. NBC_00986]|uniref:hypothetical protein n=1 Tax=Streptomyces sp. NBC_00986 TaxID=2903702 RepID=UPI0038672566|nr:hypothetical protein OG504_13050 [Streptomyces sp. NBC_00986]
MLHARRIHPPSQEYELTEDDGRAPTTFSLHRGRVGTRFTLRGVDYLVRTHRLSGVYELLDADGTPVATTDRVCRSRHMTCSERVIPFQRTAMAGREYTMIGGDDGEPAGTIRRTGTVHSEATADLPGVALVPQVFALVVLLLRARRKRTAAAARPASLAGG